MANNEAALKEPEAVSNTLFVFQHKVFNVEGCYFSLDSNTKPALNMRLGEMDVAVSFPQLRSEFGIEETDPDGLMMKMVADALNFVRKIRPNDSIPSELLDGSASWSTEEHHLERAKTRMTMLLVSLITGKEGQTVDAAQVLDTLEASETKAMIQDAFEEIAEKLGYGSHRKGEVADKVDQFASELSYIEALKDRVQLVASLRTKIQKIASFKRNDQMLFQELMRMDTLIQGPLKKMADQLEAVYGQTSEILPILRNFPQQVDFVRKVRDHLRTELLEWNEYIDAWERQPAEPSEEALQLCKKTYRFLAMNYQQTQQWGLTM